MNIRPFAACLLLLSLPAAASAQEASSSPSMNPSQSPAPSSDPTGLGLLQKDRPKGAKTEITSQDEATFDNDSNVATFKGKVVVVDPQFKLFCDVLNVYLNENRKGLDRAEAEGNVVILQENVNEKGDIVKSTGRAGKAIFEPDSGDVTLTISPSIQQGINNHVAVTPDTVMILNRQGRLSTIGASRTVIVDAAEEGR